MKPRQKLNGSQVDFKVDFQDNSAVNSTVRKKQIARKCDIQITQKQKPSGGPVDFEVDFKVDNNGVTIIRITSEKKIINGKPIRAIWSFFHVGFVLISVGFCHRTSGGWRAGVGPPGVREGGEGGGGGGFFSTLFYSLKIINILTDTSNDAGHYSITLINRTVKSTSKLTRFSNR